MDKPFRWSFTSRFILCVSAAFAVLMLGIHSVLAHAQLIRSAPPDKAELKKAPIRVELWFNELLDQSFNSIEVIPAGETSAKRPTNLAKGQPEVDSTDRTHLKVELSELKPGRYLVRYRVLSRDGHSAPGQLMFRVVE